MATRVETENVIVPYRADWRRGRLTSWLTTVDHKRIGILYIWTALGFFALGGVLALLMRTQLARRRGLPDARRVQRGGHDPRDVDDLPRHRPDPRRLRQLPGAADDRGARHGVPTPERTLVLALRPRRARPLPQLLRRAARPRRGWTSYVPLSTCTRPDGARTCGSSACTSSSISSLAGAINFVVTIHNMRRRGMTWMRIPLFVWAILTYAWLLVLGSRPCRRG